MLSEETIHSMLFSRESQNPRVWPVFACALAAMYAALAFNSGTIESLRDYFGYWLATRTYFDTPNPYSLAFIAEWKQTMGYQGSETLIVWNPPFALLLFFPLRFFSPAMGFAILWGLDVLAVAYTVRACWPPSLPTRPKPLAYILVAGLFVPLWFIFSLGQITLLLLSCGIAAWRQFQKGNDIRAGVLIALLAVKFHIFSLFALCLIMASLLSKRPRVAVSAILSLGGLSVLAEALRPGIHAQWLAAELWPPRLLGNSLIPPLWMLLSPSRNPELLKLLMAAIPACGAVLMTIFCIKRGANWCQSPAGLATALLLTPLVVPYGFIFDHILLLPVLVWLFAEASADARQTRLLSVCILLSAIIIGASSSIQVGDIRLFWYLPYVQVLLLALMFKLPRADN